MSEANALVSPDIEEVMLGSNWLRRHKCLWDFGASWLYINGHPAVALSRKRTLRCRRVYVQGDVIVSPRQEMNVRARSTLSTPSFAGPDCIVDSHQARPGLYVGRTLLPPAHCNIKVRVVNTTIEPVTIHDGMCVGNLTPVTVVGVHGVGALRKQLVNPSHAEMWRK